MCRFLEFAAERVIEGRAAELKEYVLGIEVFGRPASFDPRVDPIVRVEARRLRSKLKSYYEGEGSDDEILVEFPTGGYVPRFKYRHAPASAPAGAIAVLPFANLGAGEENAYFSDGLTEELIHALTAVPGLRVVAWHSAEKLRGQEADIYAVGRRLNVATVLSGSVRRQGGRLRIMARLIDTASGVYLWSETFDRQVEDIIAIQEEISRAIAATLQVRLAPAVIRGSANSEAYNLYLQGRSHWSRRTPESLDRAIRLFLEAVALDPGFAAAHSGLADAYTLQVDFGFCVPEAASKGKASALRAIELDPRLAEAWASLALIEVLSEWRWADAGDHFRTAIRLNPSYATARHWYGGDYLAALGRFEEALEQLRIARDLDPLSPVLVGSAADVLLFARRYEECIAMGRTMAELDPLAPRAYTVQARAHLHSGRFAEAVAMFEKGRSLAGDLPTLLGALGQAHGYAGNLSEARQLLDVLREMARTRHIPATALAMIHIGLGENDEAIQVLAGAVERREPSVTALRVHPGYDPLRADERFEALVRKVFAT
jgi:serine/threonine-protein kinase